MTLQKFAAFAPPRVAEHRPADSPGVETRDAR